ncbi:hypothetical protein IFT74_05235 [Oxalobacteraceae sp. CFBP 8755]|nr:hypothetical protein [Oxalobacteraceae sp. CFBP 8755]
MKSQEHIDADQFDDRMLGELAKKSQAYADVAAAIKDARKSCESAGLNCDYDDKGAPFFTQFQTSKTARHTREDTSATLLLQAVILDRLDRNKKYMWAIIALLLYIASQVG